MTREHTFTIGSELAASADDVWQAAGTMEGVNAELGPWLRMSSPARHAGLRIEDAPVGEVVFRSLVLFLGVVPIDIHHLRFERIDRGRGFLERSTSTSERLWEHERSVVPTSEATCTVTDRLRFLPRIPLSSPLLARVVVPAVFRHRHARLRARFGALLQG